MKQPFFKYFLTLISLLLAFFEGYSGGLHCYTSMNSQSLPFHSKAKFSASCVDFDNNVIGKWYLYIEDNNPNVTLNNLYQGTDIISKRTDGFYQLPDLSWKGTQIAYDLELTFDPLAGADPSTLITLSIFYVGNNKDSVAFDGNGKPYQYYSIAKSKTTCPVNFLPDSIINFADYTLIPTAITCDTIKYSLKERGKGYSTLSNFSVQLSLPTDFAYIPNSCRIQLYKGSDQKYTSFATEPLVQKDTFLVWNLSNRMEMNFIKADSTNYFILSFNILPRPGYTIDSISGLVSAIKSSGGSIQKTIPSLFLSPGTYPTINVLPDTLKLMEGENITLSATDVSNPLYAYRWTKNNEFLDFTAYEMYLSNVSEADSGVYRCSLYDQCHAVTSNPTVVRITKIPVIEPDPDNTTTNVFYLKDPSSLNVYPNPSNGILFLNKIASSTSYIILDLTGKPVQQGLVPANGTLSIQELLDGFYFLQIQQGEKIESVKITKN